MRTNRKLKADFIVLGGGLGGCMAALAAAKSGLTVIMTEETDWIGGQLTAQAVPPDEHRWIEQFGCTRSYAEFRRRVRGYYKSNYPLVDTAMNNEFLNPGNGWVSRLCHEPKVALQVLQDMLAAYTNSGRIQILYQHRIIEAVMEGDRCVCVKVINDDDDLVTLQGKYFADATECGDLLPLAGVEHVMGAEARADTDEPHAADNADPLDMQSITHVFALDYEEGGDHTIDRPAQYDFWRQYVPQNYENLPLLGWLVPEISKNGTIKEYGLFRGKRGEWWESLFNYRRMIDKSLFNNELYKSDISLINWPQNDYHLGSIYGVSSHDRRKHLRGARQLSLCLLYWLQTEAPRLDGGKGYPGLRLRKDALGTDDGFAKAPYIRESRRIESLYRITEHDVSKEIRGDQGIRTYEDSVGVGSYYLDLHMTTVSFRSLYVPTYPYEIPLGALLPVRVKNILPACKNIGTTQISNGCYRLHPTEWNIGESVGYLVAYALKNQLDPHDVREDSVHLQAYQDLLEQRGVQLHWPEDIQLP
ncbi:FAD-dependent oxidoreductase [Paenibacillus sp. ACRRX]|uniref:FAD-dependent oxidoreductase n=1 Tax=Paenibacillus sp. ACRRX TaxID=2918206 RepID=UPI0023B8394F|nr:FAD-dependent oxidoreductase [Paenibacillus sp. ACRRX]